MVGRVPRPGDVEGRLDLSRDVPARLGPVLPRGNHTLALRRADVVATVHDVSSGQSGGHPCRFPEPLGKGTRRETIPLTGKLSPGEHAVGPVP